MDREEDQERGNLTCSQIQALHLNCEGDGGLLMAYSPERSPALRNGIITAWPADWLSLSIRGMIRNKNGFNRNGGNCEHLITKSPLGRSLPNLLFFPARSSQSFSLGRGWQEKGADGITSINLPGARCIFITNIIGIQITEQASMSHPSTMDQLG